MFKRILLAIFLVISIFSFISVNAASDLDFCLFPGRCGNEAPAAPSGLTPPIIPPNQPLAANVYKLENSVSVPYCDFANGCSKKNPADVQMEAYVFDKVNNFVPNVKVSFYVNNVFVKTVSKHDGNIDWSYLMACGQGNYTIKAVLPDYPQIKPSIIQYDPSVECTTCNKNGICEKGEQLEDGRGCVPDCERYFQYDAKGKQCIEVKDAKTKLECYSGKKKCWGAEAKCINDNPVPVPFVISDFKIERTSCDSVIGCNAKERPAIVYFSFSIKDRNGKLKPHIRFDIYVDNVWKDSENDHSGQISTGVDVPCLTGKHTIKIVLPDYPKKVKAFVISYDPTDDCPFTRCDHDGVCEKGEEMPGEFKCAPDCVDFYECKRDNSERSCEEVVDVWKKFACWNGLLPCSSEDRCVQICTKCNYDGICDIARDITEISESFAECPSDCTDYIKCDGKGTGCIKAKPGKETLDCFYGTEKCWLAGSMSDVYECNGRCKTKGSVFSCNKDGICDEGEVQGNKVCEDCKDYFSCDSLYKLCKPVDGREKMDCYSGKKKCWQDINSCLRSSKECFFGTCNKNGVCEEGEMFVIGSGKNKIELTSCSPDCDSYFTCNDPDKVCEKVEDAKTKFACFSGKTKCWKSEALCLAANPQCKSENNSDNLPAPNDVKAVAEEEGTFQARLVRTALAISPSPVCGGIMEILIKCRPGDNLPKVFRDKNIDPCDVNANFRINNFMEMLGPSSLSIGKMSIKNGRAYQKINLSKDVKIGLRFGCDKQYISEYTDDFQKISSRWEKLVNQNPAFFTIDDPYANRETVSAFSFQTYFHANNLFANGLLEDGSPKKPASGVGVSDFQFCRKPMQGDPCQETYKFVYWKKCEIKEGCNYQKIEFYPFNQSLIFNDLLAPLFPENLIGFASDDSRQEIFRMANNFRGPVVLDTDDKFFWSDQVRWMNGSYRVFDVAAPGVAKDSITDWSKGINVPYGAYLSVYFPSAVINSKYIKSKDKIVDFVLGNLKFYSQASGDKIVESVDIVKRPIANCCGNGLPDLGVGEDKNICPNDYSARNQNDYVLDIRKKIRCSENESPDHNVKGPRKVLYTPLEITDSVHGAVVRKPFVIDSKINADFGVYFNVTVKNSKGAVIKGVNVPFTIVDHGTTPKTFNYLTRSVVVGDASSAKNLGDINQTKEQIAWLPYQLFSDFDNKDIVFKFGNAEATIFGSEFRENCTPPPQVRKDAQVQCKISAKAYDKCDVGAQIECSCLPKGTICQNVRLDFFVDKKNISLEYLVGGVRPTSMQKHISVSGLDPKFVKVSLLLNDFSSAHDSTANLPDGHGDIVIDYHLDAIANNGQLLIPNNSFVSFDGKNPVKMFEGTTQFSTSGCK